MRKLFRNKRALSTVISTILMIMVVMIGMTLLFAYVTVYAQNYKEGLGGAVMESLTVEDVWVKQGAVTVWVYNVGRLDSTILSIYDDDGIALTNSTLKINLNVDVKMGAHVKITLDCPSGSDWVKIVTKRGSEFESR